VLSRGSTSFRPRSARCGRTSRTAFAPQECLKALTYFEDEALRDLPQDMEERLLNAVKNVRSIPSVSLASSSVVD
jgi:hypothetical protein